MTIVIVVEKMDEFWVRWFGQVCIL